MTTPDRSTLAAAPIASLGQPSELSIGHYYVGFSGITTAFFPLEAALAALREIFTQLRRVRAPRPAVAGGVAALLGGRS